MKLIIHLLDIKDLSLNKIYKKYETTNEGVLIKKVDYDNSSTIETRELVDLFETFSNFTHIDFHVLENGDILLECSEGLNN